MSFSSNNIHSKYIWFNGEFIKWNDAKIHVLTHSLHYSGAVYEGERSYNGKIFKLEEHSQRLVASANAIRLKVNYSVNEIIQATQELLDKNKLKNAYIRPLAWRGAESLNLTNNILSSSLMIAAMESKPEFRTGLNLTVSPWRKPHPNSIPPQSKSSGHYAMAIAAKDLAHQNHYDGSLILDFNDNIAECTVTNIFFAKENRIVTPIADCFLNGLTRQTIIAIAKNLGFNIQEIRIKLEDIEQFDTCFTTGTAAEVRGVHSIDSGHKKFYYKNEEITLKMQQEYAKLVGKNW